MGQAIMAEQQGQVRDVWAVELYFDLTAGKVVFRIKMALDMGLMPAQLEFDALQYNLLIRPADLPLYRKRRCGQSVTSSRPRFE